MAVLAAAALILGTVGSLMTGYAPGDSNPLAHALYNAVRCFSLNGPAEGNLAWPLDVARFLAPLATVWAAAAALVGLTREGRRRRRILGGRGHTIVCGLGRQGTWLAGEALDLGEPVVALERDGANPNVEALRARGAVVLLGDAADTTLLARAGAARAGLLFSTLPEDAQGLCVGLAAGAATEARPQDLPALRVFLHVEDSELAELARRERLFDAASVPGANGLRVQFFRRDEAAARVLVTDHLPEALARAAHEGRAPHVALVGLAAMGRTVLLRLLAAPAVDRYPAFHVTVVEPHASARIRGLLAHLPLEGARNGLGDLCAFHGMDVEIEEASDLVEALRTVHLARPLDAVVTCLDDAAWVTKCALAAQGGAIPGVPWFLALREAGGLGTLLGRVARPKGAVAPVTIFGEDREVCSRAVVVHRSLDAVAQRVHEAYRATRAAASPADADASLVPWEALDPDLVRSSLGQADHIPVKLAVLGRRAVRADGDASPTAFTSDEVETLAHLEHARWCAERILAGWRFAPGPKDVAQRTTPSLVPWEALSEPQRDLDREPVRRLAGHLGLVGLAISPPTATEHAGG